MPRIPKQVTPAVREANRANGARTRGPASDRGKAQSKMNALKSGKYAERPDPVELLRHGDPNQEAERDALRAETVRCYQPADDFARQQAEQLADLQYDLRRLERVYEIAFARERELLELEQRRRAHAVRHRVIEALERDIYAQGLMGCPDSAAKFRELVVLLDQLKVACERRDFDLARKWINIIHGAPSGKLGTVHTVWRAFRMLSYLKIYEEHSGPGGEVALKQVLTMVGDDREEARENLELYELEHGPLSPAGEAARLLEVMSSRKWAWVRHQQNFLRRSIDRKVRILIDLRRGSAPGEPRHPEDGSPAGSPEQEASVADDASGTVSRREEEEEGSERDNGSELRNEPNISNEINEDVSEGQAPEDGSEKPEERSQEPEATSQEGEEQESRRENGRGAMNQH